VRLGAGVSEWGLSELQIATIDAIVGVFEGGRPFRYETVARVKSDPGGLSFGKHQVSHTSGNLFRLVSSYCEMPRADADLAAKMRARLSAVKVPPAQTGDKEKKRLASIEKQRLALLQDDELRDLLVAAASDRAMADSQDRYFYENFMLPALKAWKAAGFVHALSAAVAYDSQIQSGIAFRTAQKDKASEVAGPASAANEKEWIAAYVDARRQWLSESSSEAVRNSVYRMDEMKKLITAGAWDLTLPLTVHGYDLTAWDDYSVDFFEDAYRRDGFAKFGAFARSTKWTGRGRFLNRCLISLKHLPARTAGTIGKFDDVSVKALKDFQAKCSLPATGEVDEVTFDKLCAEAAIADARRGGAATADGFKQLPPQTTTKAPVSSTVVAGGAATAVGVGAAAAGGIDTGGTEEALPATESAQRVQAAAPEAVPAPPPVPTTTAAPPPAATVEAAPATPAVETPSATPAPAPAVVIQTPPTPETHAGAVEASPIKPVQDFFKGPTGTVVICGAFILAIALFAFASRRWS